MVGETGSSTGVFDPRQISNIRISFDYLSPLVTCNCYEYEVTSERFELRCAAGWLIELVLP